MKLVLASASPRRSDLLREAGYDFAVFPAAVEEAADEQPEDLPALTEQNAALKAGWVSQREPGAICIGADTLVTIDDKALGKPADHAEAFRMLRSLVGRTHQVCTGVCLCTAAPHPREERFHVVTEVTFRQLDDDEIRGYLNLIDPLDKAGAYAAQEHGEIIIARVEGSWTNVVGLPMERLAEVLEAFA